MGMGYLASGAIVVKNESVEQVAPNEYKAFMYFLKSEDWPLEEFAREWDGDEAAPENCSELYEQAFSLWDDLRQRFDKETGVSLYLGYHDSASGYGHVDGAYFCLASVEVYQHTPMAEAMAEKGIQFELQFLVEYV